MSSGAHGVLWNIGGAVVAGKGLNTGQRKRVV